MPVPQAVLEAWVTRRCEASAHVHSTPGPAATRPPRPSVRCAPQTQQPGPWDAGPGVPAGPRLQARPRASGQSEPRVTFTLICINKRGAPHFRTSSVSATDFSEHVTKPHKHMPENQWALATAEVSVQMGLASMAPEASVTGGPTPALCPPTLPTGRCQTWQKASGTVRPALMSPAYREHSGHSSPSAPAGQGQPRRPPAQGADGLHHRRWPRHCRRGRPTGFARRDKIWMRFMLLWTCALRRDVSAGLSG